MTVTVRRTRDGSEAASGTRATGDGLPWASAVYSTSRAPYYYCTTPSRADLTNQRSN
eukprot:COSAG06_NODE_429_length_15872_cov_25.578330_23_plen_57_part_00